MPIALSLMNENSASDVNFNRKPVEGNPKGRGPLPFIKSIAEATALCEKEQDSFYLDAFMIEAWLGDVVVEAAEEYAEKKNPKDRAMQTGQAWRSFLKIFGHAHDEEFPHILENLFRFSEYEDVFAEMLLQTIFPMGVGHECFSDLIKAKAVDLAREPAEAVRLMRRTIERWCEWLDALIHWHTHAMWHLSPVSFDPDPEKRELAALGINQRAFIHLSDFSKSWWAWHHREAAERFKDSPKWQMVGIAMAGQEQKTWNYPDLDNVVIGLWPLVKRHNWTYRDLSAVISRELPKNQRYPLAREQDLAAYCANVLGLRKPAGPPGKSSADGRPIGHEVALRLCQHAPPTTSS